MRLWNYVEGRCLKTYQGHRNVRYSISGTFGVYSEGKQAFAASGSEDGSFLLWDVTSKEMLQRIEGHRGVVLGLDAREELLVSGGVDGSVRVWQAREEGGDEVVVGGNGRRVEEEGERAVKIEDAMEE